MMAYHESQYVENLPPRSKYQSYRDDAKAMPGEWVLVVSGPASARGKVKDIACAAAGGKERKTRNKRGNGFEASTRTVGEDENADDYVWGMIRYEEE